MRPKLALLPVALALLLASCDVIPPPQVDATRYYVLTAAAAPAAGTAAPDALHLGLKSIALAGYLQTRDLVVRRGPNELELNDYACWAEPLDSGIARALRARLLADPAVGSVCGPPPAAGPRDYDVAVEILHCEGDGDTVAFAARIQITAVADNRVVARRVFVAPASAWDGKDYGQLASRLSDDVAALGGVILAALPPKS